MLQNQNPCFDLRAAKGGSNYSEGRILAQSPSKKVEPSFTIELRAEFCGRIKSREIAEIIMNNAQRPSPSFYISGLTYR
jgi:hypothetical protein